MDGKQEFKEIFSKKIRAGRRTYFFDVRATKAEDYYMTITESIKDFNDEGTPSYRKHKIYLYKEDFNDFKDAFEAVSKYIIAEKGEEIISGKKFEKKEEKESAEIKEKSSTEFTEVNFDDLGKD
ncbi:MAG: DNA-binding protein [Flavobacteriales bacterium]|jgi:hypothetical protein|nr:DNA-binding protein [Flavobacteriales bacterium]|tara:strand:+ start:998 stop:1369 length:372 start_codon:yes stop_codon:yes gene_type:complete